MGLLSFFKRQDDATPAASSAPDAVVVARTRARRRLIGASVLLAIGIVGFPLLFETQPRPIPVDIPIEIPRKDHAPALTLPPARPAPSVVVAPAEPTDDPATAASAAAPTQAPAAQVAEAPRTAASTPPVPAPRAASAAAVAPRPASVPKAGEGQRAQALLEGKAEAATKASDAAGMRMVVQVGAYTDADKLREARLKVEKLGMKTYTQVVEADGGRRTRVRVGPFPSRDEAEKAASRLKAAGLPAAILAL
ncbi:SPOR domain-containing protein [Ideonella sp. A 288]|uniref:SPOR domain-containing protein n=1 Tax=Ideonella sp. A 288 TaxID=1962181 RepID=UPI000B4BBE5D|nr:SPOR domain-containing protein [Ideonella sp. A 288]